MRKDWRQWIWMRSAAGSRRAFDRRRQQMGRGRDSRRAVARMSHCWQPRLPCVPFHPVSERADEELRRVRKPHTDRPRQSSSECRHAVRSADLTCRFVRWRKRKIFTADRKRLLHPSARLLFKPSLFKEMLGWWNWQTRTFEGRMPKGVRVQVPSRVPHFSSEKRRNMGFASKARQ